MQLIRQNPQSYKTMHTVYVTRRYDSSGADWLLKPKYHMSSGVPKNQGAPANYLSEESRPCVAKGPCTPHSPATLDVAAHLAGGLTGPPATPYK